MKTIVITGAGRGMGLQVTKKHTERGDRVYAISHSRTEELAALDDANQNLHVILCELTDDASVEAACGLIVKPVDILYNIAGLYSHEQNCGLEGMDFDISLKMYNVNALAPMRVLKALEGLLHEGSIVMNVSSEAGSVGQAGRTGEYGYCMSKAGLNMGVKLFDNAHRDGGIFTFAYHPGWIRTQMGGERAMASPYSISAEYAAECVMKITDHPAEYYARGLYWDYEGNQLPW